MRRFNLPLLFMASPVSALLVAALVSPVSCTSVPDVSQAVKLDREPRIDPDYTSLVIPPNVAPLNFRITEDGRDFLVVISSNSGRKLQVRCRDGKCEIPLKPWRRLLRAARGEHLRYDIHALRQDGTWVRFKPVTNTVAEEPIDSHIVYRLLAPNKACSMIRGIYQRDVSSFRKSPLLTTRDGTIHCFNCHTFHQHDPNRFLLHVRGEHEGMVLVTDGEIRKIDTKQDPMFRPLAYASWHPDGKHIAATCNRFIGHAPAKARRYYFQALEKRGDLVVYDLEENSLRATKAAFGHEYIETHPCWSPDGKYIYYCRGEDIPIVEPRDWENSDFDLMRVSYDVSDESWGEPETVKAYSELGLCCSFPRPSPCGKYVLHVLADKTTYPIHQESSDLYLLDLETKEHRKLDVVSSELSESYPRWSSNGRWFTFLSNRRDAMSALPYMAYFDTEGQAHKAFVLPQRDPEFFDTFIDTYNVLELVKSRVDVDTFRLAQEIQQPARDATFGKPPDVDAYTGPTRPYRSSY